MFSYTGIVPLPAPLTPHVLLQGSLGPPGPPGLGVSTGVSSWWEFEGPEAPQMRPLCSFFWGPECHPGCILSSPVTALPAQGDGMDGGQPPPVPSKP